MGSRLCSYCGYEGFKPPLLERVERQLTGCLLYGLKSVPHCCMGNSRKNYSDPQYVLYTVLFWGFRWVILFIIGRVT